MEDFNVTRTRFRFLDEFKRGHFFLFFRNKTSGLLSSFERPVYIEECFKLGYLSRASQLVYIVQVGLAQCLELIERSWLRFPAGAFGEFSSPELTFCADSYSVSVPPSKGWEFHFLQERWKYFLLQS